MTRVHKIAHATYETPDLDEQTEYYTEILGLTLVSKEKDTVYLASTVDHHSVVLRRGAHAQCVRLGFQFRPTPTSPRSRSMWRATVSKRNARKIRSPRSRRW